MQQIKHTWQKRGGYMVMEGPCGSSTLQTFCGTKMGYYKDVDEKLQYVCEGEMFQKFWLSKR
jgi:hypothetical protein